MKHTNQDKSRGGSQGPTRGDMKQRGVSNSGGQRSDQTDNKQATVNKGNVNPDVQGKVQAPKKPSESSPKKK